MKRTLFLAWRFLFLKLAFILAGKSQNRRFGTLELSECRKVGQEVRYRFATFAFRMLCEASFGICMRLLCCKAVALAEMLPK